MTRIGKFRSALGFWIFRRPFAFFMETVTIKTFSDQTDADLAAAELERAGIPHILVNDDASGMLPPLRLARGVKIMVEEQRAEEARKILAHDDSPADHGELPPESANQREPFSGMPLGLFVGLIFGIAGAMG